VADRLPLWRNVRWFQLVFGAFVAVISFQLYEGGLSQGGIVLRVLGLGVALIVFVVYLQNIHRFGLVPDYSLKCRFCNGPVNRYSEFCEHCGADLIADEKLVPCRKCGAELYEGTQFCPECGTKAPRVRAEG
jgi:hypothetical protein